MAHLRRIVSSLALLATVISMAGCGQSQKGELSAESSTTSQANTETDATPLPIAAKSNESTVPKPDAPAGTGKKGHDVAEKPRPKTRATLEPPGVETLELIETVQGKESEAYQGRGHDGLNFGETKDSLTAKKLIVGRMPSSEFFGLKDNREVLFMPDGDLVGIGYVHSSRDNERTSAKLIDLFGKPEPENVEQFSTASRSTLRVTYHFPNVVIVVRYVFGTSTGITGMVQKTERVLVEYYDRRWVVQELAAHIEQQRAATARFVAVVEAGSIPDVELEKLPSWPESRIEEKKTSGWKGHYWVPNVNKDSGEKKPPRNPNSPDPNWFAALVSLTSSRLLKKSERSSEGRNSKPLQPSSCFFSHRGATRTSLGPWLRKPPGASRVFQHPARTSDHPKGTVLSTLRVPTENRRLLEKTNLDYLLIRANSALAQESFPPRSDSITVKSMGTAKSFEWLTKDYLIVQINADNTVVVARRPN